MQTATFFCCLFEIEMEKVEEKFSENFQYKTFVVVAENCFEYLFKTFILYLCNIFWSAKLSLLCCMTIN